MTTLPLRRGACPSLSAPMQTGDGFLVRLNPRNGSLFPAQLRGVAEAAKKFGNGLLEITARGSLQIRGLSAASAPHFAAAVAALGIEAVDGAEVRVGALAGLDLLEVADPRPLAEAVRSGIRGAGWAERLAPKISVTIDGGGALPLAGIAADVELKARIVDGQPMWSLRAGAAPLGCGHAGTAAAGTLAVLERLARRGRQARAKDLSAAELGPVASRLQPPETSFEREAPRLPVGCFSLKDGGRAHGFAPAFGQTEAGNLIRFCAAMEEDAEVRLAPGRGLIVVGGAGDRLRKIAADAGFVGDAADVRLKIAACAGAPGCASAWLDTRRLAALVAEEGKELLRAGPSLHLSGCSKGCAKPAGPAASLVGGTSGPEFVSDGSFAGARLGELLKALAEGGAARTKVPA